MKKFEKRLRCDVNNITIFLVIISGCDWYYIVLPEYIIE